MSAKDTNDLPIQDELSALKARADLLNISYHPSIGLEKLRAKVTAAIEGTPDPDAIVLTKEEAETPAPAGETEAQLRVRMKKEMEALVRVNVQCRNPAKKEWQGEIFTVSNSVTGTMKKFVMFDTPDGYHIPKLMLNMMREREFLDFIKRKDDRGRDYLEKKLSKEFLIEVMDPLTPAQLEELARRQAMRTGKTV